MFYSFGSSQVIDVPSTRFPTIMNPHLSTSEAVEPPAVRPTNSFGNVKRILLLGIVFALVLWHSLSFICSWALLPANDFGRMYISAAQFVDGRDMYAWTLAAPAHLEEDYSIDLYNMNPPHFHLLLLPLTLLHNPDYAFVLWWVLSGLCLFHCANWTLAETGVQLTPQQRQCALVLLLAFSGTVAMLYTAQLSFVLLVPVTLMWLAARRGLWGWSGALLGLVLSVKPFLGVLLVYLWWRGRWRAAASCLAVVALCFAAGVLVFGWGNHLSWHGRLTDSQGWAWLPMNASLTGMLSRTFTTSVWYVPLTVLSDRTVWWLWAGVGGVLGLVTLRATNGGDSAEGVDQDFCLLLVASVWFCPLGWIYYLWLALPPAVGLLWRDWPLRAGSSRRQRWLTWVMVVSFLWSPILTRLFQPEFLGTRRGRWLPPLGEGWPFPPQAIATFFIGNVYFWGVFAAWVWLTERGFSFRKKPRPSFTPHLAPLAAADYRISVVMPVFSETDTVRQIAEWLMRELGESLCEIIIVQSPRSSERCRDVCCGLVEDYPQVRLHTQRNNPGLGWAVREGFALAQGNLVLMIDSDGEMEIETVPRLVAEMARGGHALVAASRWSPGGGFTGYSRVKYYLNWCFQQLFRTLFGTRLHDLTYGFKLLRAELVRGLDWEGTLHEIACETTLKPVRLGVSVAEVPSRWTARTQGSSKNTFWRNFRYVRLAAAILFRGVSYTAREPLAESADQTQRDEAEAQPVVACSAPGQAFTI